MIFFRFTIVAVLSLVLFWFTYTKGYSTQFLYILVALEIAHIISLIVRKKRVRMPIYLVFYAVLTIIYYLVLQSIDL